MTLSVVIPSRESRFLQQTVDDLIAKADSEVEVVVVLDGYWPKPMLKNHKQVVVIHQGTQHNNLGMREAINAGMAVAKGEYVGKVDEHCMFAPGYDIEIVKSLGG